ncbi:CaiB/BaiF CoA transferase family protein [Clostridium sp.]|uniref:CaiB/BaiF CoA transferase family protein n=1 Tax=Clostridium sp. TaxID=1506 RepID=UPI003F2B8A9D
MLPLKNVKVLDLTIMGGYTGMELADYGAEVIKVESESGDYTRKLAPFKDGVSVWQSFIDRGKKSIILDLESDKDRGILKELIKSVDVIVENFKPGKMEGLGVGYEALCSINPKLIYAKFNSFDGDGGMEDYTAYDVIAQAKSGVVDVTGFPSPNKPSKMGVSVGAHYTSTYLASAIIFALYHSRATGKGQMIDVSMIESLFSITEDKMAICDFSENEATRTGNAHPSINPYDILKCKDGYVALGISTDNQWEKFCVEFNLEEWINDPRYSDNLNRGLNYFGDLREKLEDYLTENYTKAEITEKFSKIKVPAAGCNTVLEAMNQEQLKIRNMIVKVEDKRIGNIDMVGKTIKFHDNKDEKIKSAPILGENNNEIYQTMLSKEFLDILGK